MYKSLYKEVSADNTANTRETERAAFVRAISLLRAAQGQDPQGREAVEAIFFTNQLWCTLLEDLSKTDNGLPQELRASLISIGIWVLRRTEDIREGRTDDFAALIDVSQTICDGLGR